MVILLRIFYWLFWGRTLAVRRLSLPEIIFQSITAELQYQFEPLLPNWLVDTIGC